MGGTRLARVSPLFDAPQFCRDFIKTMKGCEIKHRDICIRYQTKEESGPEAKRPYKLVWKDYEGQ